MGPVFGSMGRFGCRSGNLLHPLSELVERLGSLLVVAGAVGEVDVVEVVGSSSRDGGEVLKGERHGVGWAEGVVDPCAAETAGLVACFPFCVDELSRGVAFEFGLRSAHPEGGYLVWVTDGPSLHVCVMALFVFWVFQPSTHSLAL